VGAPARTLYFALSPDEKTVAVPRRASSGNNTDIWLHEIARGVETRFTFHASSRNEGPVWSPDGRRIAFFSSRAGRTDLFLKDTSGTGQDELLLESALNKYPTDWSRDGRFLLYTETGSKTGFDLWILPEPGAAGRDSKPVPFLQSPFNETQGQFSPDGHWIAYTSDESGRQEVYVRPFPPEAGKWKISISGGQFPRWRHDGKEVFYLAPERKLMAVPVKADVGARPMFEAAAPQTLFEARIPSITPGFNQFVYAVAADGKRLLVNTTRSDIVETPLTVVVNWLAAVKK
jgi:Tol biopolymer transport system component